MHMHINENNFREQMIGWTPKDPSIMIIDNDEGVQDHKVRMKLIKQLRNNANQTETYSANLRDINNVQRNRSN